MRISLINVQFHEGNNMFPPLGVLYVGAALREAGHRVQILDGDPLLETDLVDRIAAFEPELVGMSFLTMTISRARTMSEALRARLPGVPVMLGGPHVTAEPERSLVDFDAEVVVVGEGEITAVEVAARYAAGLKPEGIAGTVTASGKGPPRAAIEDLDTLPMPARDLCDFERYLSPPGLIRGWASRRHASVMASRGCPYRCTFCASHLQLGRRFRLRSIDDVLAELDLLVDRYAIEGVYWVDDIFTGDRQWVRELCARLTERPYRLEWGCQSRVTGIDRPTLEAMKAAGCVQVDFGVESGSQRILNQMKKGTRTSDIEEAFALVHDVGLRTGASFIFGSPGEEAEDVLETIALADRIQSDWTVFFFSTPYPGTELWQQVRDSDFFELFPDYGESWNNRQRKTPFTMTALSPQQLAEFRRIAQNRAFRRNYLHTRNSGYALRLLGVAMSQPVLIRDAIVTFLTGGRLDDAVEAWFAADRAKVTARRWRSA
ncbi:MAG: anaerobic magnesium-protoporphyrin IX monomethyl ester cyclase [Myxococcota bacterium]|jgi:anaerobic magnesium-protoporphyrin IX monomethyl ester cyclase